MYAVVQRVSSASVAVADDTAGAIGVGLVVLLGVEDGDTELDASALVDKIATLRVFPTERGHFETSLVDVAGSVLLVSQFTLAADMRRGRRPSFTAAAKPDVARPLVEAAAALFEQHGIKVETGVFGAMMSVSLINEGPATFVLRSSEGKVS